MKLNKLLAIAFCSAAMTAAAAPGVVIKQSLDSAYIIMGRTTTVNIELLKNGTGGRLVVQRDAYPPEVEIADSLGGDTTAMGNDRYEIRRQLTIQSFDSGLYRLPPVLYIEGNETIASAGLALKVVPVDVDSLKDIHDYAPVQDSGIRWYDRLPDWLVDYWWAILLGLLLIAGALTYYFLYYRKGRKPAIRLRPAAKPIPPYEEAVMRLDALRAEHLCENGREREFYTSLTEILRNYLYRRFGINAMEMTSTQIRHALDSNPETRLSRMMMDQVLEMADFVKFAKARPLPDDNVRVFNSARQFVEDTRPRPAVTEPEADGNTAKKPEKQ